MQNERALENREWPEEHKPWCLSWNVIEPPINGTLAAHGFFRVWADTNHLLAFVLYMVAHIEESSQTIRRFLGKLESSQARGEKDRGKTPRDLLTHHRQLIAELLLTRHIDNLQTYLSSLLHEVLLGKPELLRSNEKVDVREVLEQESLDDVIRLIAERKVQSLTYESFSKVCSYFMDRTGLILFHEEDLPIIIEAIETRNICAHNGCVINKRYVARTQKSIELLGTRRQISMGEVEALAILLGRAVSRLDKFAAEKFDLETGSFVINPIAGHSDWTV